MVLANPYPCSEALTSYVPCGISLSAKWPSKSVSAAWLTPDNIERIFTRTLDAGSPFRFKYTVPAICPVRPPQAGFGGISTDALCAFAEGTCESKAITKGKKNVFGSFDFQHCQL